MVHGVHAIQGVPRVVPHLRALRRVSRRYWHCLPLHVMQRHQCIVVGGEQGILTVAMADCRQTHLLTYLQLLTGCAIFPVQVDPARVRLLIKRVEWYPPFQCKISRKTPFHHPLMIRAMLAFCRVNHAS